MLKLLIARQVKKFRMPEYLLTQYEIKPWCYRCYGQMVTFSVELKKEGITPEINVIFPFDFCK